MCNNRQIFKYMIALIFLTSYHCNSQEFKIKKAIYGATSFNLKGTVRVTDSLIEVHTKELEQKFKIGTATEDLTGKTYLVDDPNYSQHDMRFILTKQSFGNKKQNKYLLKSDGKDKFTGEVVSVIYVIELIDD